MGSVTKYFLIGLIAIHTVQQSLGKPTGASTPDCTNLKDGQRIAGKNKSSFFFCHKGKAIQAFCPKGHDFCYTGSFGICSKWCMNMEDTESAEQGEAENTPSPVDGEDEETNNSGSGEESGDKSGEGSDDKSDEKSAEDSSENAGGDSDENAGEDGGENTGEEAGENTDGEPGENTDQAQTEPTAAPTATEPTTTQSTAPTTTPEPPNPQTACDKQPFGSIFAIKNDCSAFGICMFGKPIITKCLGNRRFDPKLGACTGIKCK